MLTRQGYLIRKDSLTKSESDNIRKNLVVQPITEGNYTSGESFKVYRESEMRFRLPKFWALDVFGTEFIDRTVNGVPIDVEFHGKLNEKTCQPVAVQKTLESLHSSGGGILCLPPGYGKTTVSLFLISQLKVKTLVIVHKEFLMSQWKERISQFLPSATVGCIQQNKVDILGKSIVMGMLQSLSSKEYHPSTFETFGLVIIDETHHICSRTFSKALFNVCPKYILGLTATPNRKDGLTKVLHWFLGPITFKIERKHQDTVRVVAYHYKDPYFTHDNIPYNISNKVNGPVVVNRLCDLSDRNVMIVSIVHQLLSLQRKIIILSERRHHCEELLSKARTLETPFIYGLYMGGMAQHELEESEKADAIFATYSMAQEGLDIPTLDTLILATPKTDIVQASGRIMRETEGKKNYSLIIDICDSWAPLAGKYPKRKVFYKKSGFKSSSQSCTPISLDDSQFTRLSDSAKKKMYSFLDD